MKGNHFPVVAIPLFLAKERRTHSYFFVFSQDNKKCVFKNGEEKRQHVGRGIIPFIGKDYSKLVLT
jgi:hypothetical protein